MTKRFCRVLALLAQLLTDQAVIVLLQEALPAGNLRVLVPWLGVLLAILERRLR